MRKKEIIKERKNERSKESIKEWFQVIRKQKCKKKKSNKEGKSCDGYLEWGKKSLIEKYFQ